MEDFRRKARLVAGGHTTTAWPQEGPCAHNTALAKEKIWTILGLEHGKDAGEKATVFRALHGLKSSGAAPRAHLGKCMHSLGCDSCLADPDLWLKAKVDE